MQSDPSNAGDGDKSFRNPQSRSPVGRMQGSDDDPAQRSLNRDGKHTRSSRKIKPMYPIPNTHGSKQILKVVQEDNNSSAHESNQMSRHGPQGQILIPANNINNMSPVSNISAPQGSGSQQ